MNEQPGEEETARAGAAIEQAVTEGNAGHPLDILRDAQLLRIFHYAKSLEEIDQMDYGRLSRALEVNRLAELESRRQVVIAGKAKPDTITTAEWAEIDEWDRTLRS